MQLATCSVRPEVEDFSPYSAGLSIDEIRQKYGVENVIKMASNENPLGASPRVMEAVSRAAGNVFRYAQSGNPRLSDALAAHHNVAPGNIVTGNGSDEVIDLLIRARAVPGRHNVVAFRPCFSLYKLQSRLCGVEFRQAPLKPDFSFDWAALAALVDENTALVFITTPDNPSSYCPPLAEVRAFAAGLPKGCLLAIDEAYMDFCAYRAEPEHGEACMDFCAHGEGPEQGEAAWSLLPELAAKGFDNGNVAILRTFSKSYGLAGLRLGYGIMPSGLADYLRRIRPPFSVNILAEEAGLAALADHAFRAATLRTVSEGRAFLTRELAALGCRVYPGRANFLMFTLPSENGGGNASGAKTGSTTGAADFFEALLRRGIIIRRLASYDLPDHLRISVGNAEENAAFIKAAAEIL